MLFAQIAYYNTFNKTTMPPVEVIAFTNIVRPDVYECTSGHTDLESASGWSHRFTRMM